VHITTSSGGGIRDSGGFPRLGVDPGGVRSTARHCREVHGRREGPVQGETGRLMPPRGPKCPAAFCNGMLQNP
jgi:hypothetical protein